MFLKSNLLVEQLANRRSNNSMFMWNFNCKIKVSLTINLKNTII
jgi:hypothetical protein